MGEQALVRQHDCIFTDYDSPHDAGLLIASGAAYLNPGDCIIVLAC